MSTCHVCGHGFEDTRGGAREHAAHLGTHPGRAPHEIDAALGAFGHLLKDAESGARMRRRELDAIPHPTSAEDMDTEDRALLAQDRHAATERLTAAESRLAQMQEGHGTVLAQVPVDDDEPAIEQSAVVFEAAAAILAARAALTVPGAAEPVATE